MYVDYEYIEHTADIGIKAYGTRVEQVFENAAKGMFSIMYEVIDKGYDTVLDVEVEERSDNKEQMLLDWLNELLFLSETKHMVFVDFKVERIDGLRLVAKAFGSAFDPKKHRYKTEIKSTTYHMLELGKEKDKYYGRVLFDL
jgi:SHS2 domain-containing protein